MSTEPAAPPTPLRLIAAGIKTADELGYLAAQIGKEERRLFASLPASHVEFLRTLKHRLLELAIKAEAKPAGLVVIPFKGTIS